MSQWSAMHQTLGSAAMQHSICIVVEVQLPCRCGRRSCQCHDKMHRGPSRSMPVMCQPCTLFCVLVHVLTAKQGCDRCKSTAGVGTWVAHDAWHCVDHRRLHTSQ